MFSHASIAILLNAEESDFTHNELGGQIIKHITASADRIILQSYYMTELERTKLAKTNVDRCRTHSNISKKYPLHFRR